LRLSAFARDIPKFGCGFVTLGFFTFSQWLVVTDRLLVAMDRSLAAAERLPPGTAVS
jgi:hypothetical protein